MKTSIVYMSKHGTTEKVVNIISEHLTRQSYDVFNLKDNKNPDISGYDFVIIGGSIHAGMVQKRVKQFCVNNASLLMAKKVGLFLCCMEVGEKATLQFNNAYPVELREHAFYSGLMGGECLTDKMNFFERNMVRMAVGGPEKYPKLNYKAINMLLQEISELIPKLN
jgi:menaquinone-dependent protoporphyrinogen oxidase